jgi:hypothetical protein
MAWKDTSNFLNPAGAGISKSLSIVLLFIWFLFFDQTSEIFDHLSENFDHSFSQVDGSSTTRIQDRSYCHHHLSAYNLIAPVFLKYLMYHQLPHY